MRLSSKLQLLTRFGFTVLNFYLVGYLMLNSSLIISLLSAMAFAYLLAKSVVMVIYIQWRASHNWKEEWEPNDESYYN